ncbi:unnamed protein product [Vitrella brassicaformis CCMP3155]|uniref:Uncharacterized protein n=1 Tax=Vitrella brassicaformis (strain CCMP3155) TaxID=1169540 RepID=A0A0G4EQT0_VITBC|nr:unnamed protein product [Vitrella brassicaformis CCMP3155]|eukprot:CEL99828.1 unnamed protein product [Vitrella brassicaformis CCMP3155]
MGAYELPGKLAETGRRNRGYHLGPLGPFCLPVGLIPDALFSLAYSLMACLPVAMAILHSCDRSNMLARALPVCHLVPIVIIVGLTLAAFDWLGGQQHGGSGSLRCGLRMAIALIVVAAGTPRVLGKDFCTFAAGGFRVLGAHLAVCDNGARPFRRVVAACLVLLILSLALLPYGLLKGDKVHQATREALLQLQHRRAADPGGLLIGMVSLYIREGSYYLMIAVVLALTRLLDDHLRAGG